jgi:hypothetical protein
MKNQSMTKKEAQALAEKLIKNGYIYSDENRREWLTDGDVWVYLNEKSDWKDWQVDNETVFESSAFVPDSYGGDTLLVCRYCKNKDCNNPVQLSDIRLVEVSDGFYQIEKA